MQLVENPHKNTLPFAIFLARNLKVLLWQFRTMYKAKLVHLLKNKISIVNKWQLLIFLLNLKLTV